jgi:hypothetical protein
LEVQDAVRRVEDVGRRRLYDSSGCKVFGAAFVARVRRA